MDSITKRHWMPAVAVKNCSNPNCSLKFVLYARKHHCRSCGNIFCTDCASYSLPLDPATAQVSVNGIWAKVCILCHERGVEDGFGQEDEDGASDQSDGESENIPPHAPKGEAGFVVGPSLQRSKSLVVSESKKKAGEKSPSVDHQKGEPKFQTFKVSDSLRDKVSTYEKKKKAERVVERSSVSPINQERVKQLASFSDTFDSAGDVIVEDTNMKEVLKKFDSMLHDKSTLNASPLASLSENSENSNSNRHKDSVVTAPYRNRPLSRASVFEVPVTKAQLVRGNSLPSGNMNKVGLLDLSETNTSNTGHVTENSGTLVKDKLVKWSMTNQSTSRREGVLDDGECIDQLLEVPVSIMPKIHQFNDIISRTDSSSRSDGGLGQRSKKRSGSRKDKDSKNLRDSQVSEKLRELRDLWESRVSSRRPAPPPIIRSKGAKTPRIQGLMTKSNGSPRFLVPSPLRSQELYKHSYVPQAIPILRSRASFSERGPALSPSPSPLNRNRDALIALQDTLSLSDRMIAYGNSTNLKPQSVSRISDRKENPQSAKKKVSVETKRRLIDAMETPEINGKIISSVVEFYEKDNNKNDVQGKDVGRNDVTESDVVRNDVGRGEAMKLVTSWSVKDVCDWLTKDVPLSVQELPEIIESFEKENVNGPKLLGLQREDRACSVMGDSDWSVFQGARKDLAGSKEPIERESPPEIILRSGHDLTFDFSPGGSTAPSPYSPRSPAFSEPALWSPMATNERSGNTEETDNIASWLWNLIGSNRSEKSERQVQESEVKARALYMEVQNLRGEILAADERESTVRAQVNHVEDALQNAKLAEYMPTRTRWEALPGEIEVPDGDVDDWLPRFVVLKGSTLLFYLQASDLEPQGTVSLRSSVRVGRMEHNEHSAGNDGQWEAFFVVSEHGMRLECSVRSHYKYALWLESIREAMA